MEISLMPKDDRSAIPNKYSAGSRDATYLFVPSEEFWWTNAFPMLMVAAMDPISLIRSHRGMFSKIADGLGLARSTVSGWTKIPGERVVDVERITGIDRHILRPDLHRPPGNAACQPATMAPGKAP